MIGIFDSGIGGLTVVKELIAQYPQANFIYLGDTARTPYGDKSPEILSRYAIDDVRFLLNRGATEILIACNTISANCLDDLKKFFPDIVFYDVISPAVGEVAARHPATIGVIGTRATINSRAYSIALQTALPAAKIRSKACPLFVPWIENALADHHATGNMIEFYLQDFREHPVEILILGCTHYPIIQTQIAKYLGGSTTIINTAQALVASLPSDWIAKISHGRQQFCFTDVTQLVETTLVEWFGQGVTAQAVNLISEGSKV